MVTVQTARRRQLTLHLASGVRAQGLQAGETVQLVHTHSSTRLIPRQLTVTATPMPSGGLDPGDGNRTGPGNAS